MITKDLLQRVTEQLAASRRSVVELEYIRDQLLMAQSHSQVGDVRDYIPGIGRMRRSDAYRAAIRLGGKKAHPSYVDEEGTIYFLYSSNHYISIAKRLGLGQVGRGVVLLTVTEHAEIKAYAKRKNPILFTGGIK